MATDRGLNPYIEKALEDMSLAEYNTPFTQSDMSEYNVTERNIWSIIGRTLNPSLPQNRLIASGLEKSLEQLTNQKELVLQQDDPLCGVLSEEKVGFDPLPGRPTISHKVDKGKGIVFDFEASKRTFQITIPGPKLLGSAMAVSQRSKPISLCNLQMSKGKKTMLSTDMFAVPTVNTTVSFTAGCSGKALVVVKKRCRPPRLMRESGSTEEIGTSQRRVQETNLWQPPERGFLKCNIGVSVSSQRRLCGGSWIVRDHMGKALLHSRRAFSFVDDIVDAKHIMFMWTIDCMKSHCLDKMHFAIECRELIGGITSPPDWPAFSGHAAQLLAALEGFSAWKVEHVDHVSNRCAMQLPGLSHGRTNGDLMSNLELQDGYMTSWKRRIVTFPWHEILTSNVHYKSDATDV